MKTTQILRGIFCLVAVLSFATGLVTAASAAVARPAGMSEAAYAALMARGQALNERYGNAETRMSPAEFRAVYVRGVALNRFYRLGDFAPPETVSATAGTSVQPDAGVIARGQTLNERYGNGETRISPAEFRAVYLRGVALNRLYQLGDFARPVASPTTPAGGNGFDWTNVTVGVVAVLGLMLLAAAATVATRNHWHRPVPHGH